MAILEAPAPVTTAPTTESAPPKVPVTPSLPAGESGAGTSQAGTPPITTTAPSPAAKDLEARLEALTKMDISVKEKQRQADILIKKYETAAPALELLATGKTVDGLRSYFGDKWNPQLAASLLMELAAHAAPEEETPEQTFKRLRDAEKAEEERLATEKKEKDEKESKARADEGWAIQLKNSATFLRTAVAEGKYPLIQKWDADPDVDHKADYEKEWVKQLDANEAKGMRGMSALPTFENVWDAIEAKYTKRRAYYVDEKPAEPANETLWQRLERERPTADPLPVAPALNTTPLSGEDEARQRLRAYEQEKRERDRISWGR